MWPGRASATGCFPNSWSPSITGGGRWGCSAIPGLRFSVIPPIIARGPLPMWLALFTFLTMALLNPASSEARIAAYPRLHAADRRDRVLIVAPHIDDEAIGAGGYAIDA